MWVLFVNSRGRGIPTCPNNSVLAFSTFFHLILYDNKRASSIWAQLSLKKRILIEPMDLGKSYRYHFREFCYITLRLSLLSSHRYKWLPVIFIVFCVAHDVVVANDFPHPWFPNDSKFHSFLMLMTLSAASHKNHLWYGNQRVSYWFLIVAYQLSNPIPPYFSLVNYFNI